MNTRNSSRGARNNSFTGTRGSSTFGNNISIDLQDSSGAKTKVVHSPAPRTQVNRAQSSGNLSSSSLFQDIVVTDNQNSASQPQLVAAPEEIPSRSSLNPNVDPLVHASTSSSGAPRAPNTDYANPNSTNSFDSLVALMQQTIWTTQEEFRRELTSIRESISQIGNAPTTSSNRPPEMLHNFTSSQTPNSNRRWEQNRIVENTNVKLEKWKISYDGTGSVSDFLFKVETLCTRSKCSDEHLLSNFHILLEGRAESWYWLFSRQNRNITYAFLRNALIKEFEHSESDHEVLLKISLRKQQFKETYDDFHASVVAMNLRLQNPLPDVTLIDIMKRNLNPNLRFLMFNSDSRDINDFRDIARKAEKVLRETKLQTSNIVTSRNINEIDTLLPEVCGSEYVDPQVEALKLPNKKFNHDYSGIKCWNCLEFGHSYIYCSEEIKKPFCFKCGQKGTLTPKCPNKHSFLGNRKVGEMATGDTRPHPQTPGLN